MSDDATAVEIAHLKGEIAELKATCAEFRKELRGARDFQLWLTGGFAGLGLFAGLFIENIKDRLGL